jgi:hypothetical protein
VKAAGTTAQAFRPPAPVAPPPRKAEGQDHHGQGGCHAPGGVEGATSGVGATRTPTATSAKTVRCTSALFPRRRDRRK